MRTITSLSLSILLWTSLLVATPVTTVADSDDSSELECDRQRQTGINDFLGHVEYSVTYDPNSRCVCIVAENTGDRNGHFKYSVWVDGSRIFSSGAMELNSGDTFSQNQSITEGIDATRDNHTIEVHSYNGTFYFNFTREVNPMDESGIPTPHVEELRVKRNGTKSGHPRLILEVENQGLRTYVPEAEVRTFESDSRRLQDDGNSNPGGQYSVRLSEANVDVIVGTVRLYGGKFNPGVKFDRVSFVSYPNGTYETWEPAFGEIPTHREIEEREIYYENESAQELRGPDVDPISETASRAGAVLITLTLLGGFWYWRRRKPS